MLHPPTEVSLSHKSGYSCFSEKQNYIENMVEVYFAFVHVELLANHHVVTMGIFPNIMLHLTLRE